MNATCYACQRDQYSVVPYLLLTEKQRGRNPAIVAAENNSYKTLKLMSDMARQGTSRLIPGVTEAG